MKTTIVATATTVLAPTAQVPAQPPQYASRFLADAALISGMNESGEVVGWDVVGDGTVGILDFLLLLAAWSRCRDPPDPCPADLDDDCQVGVNDCLILLANGG